MFALLGRVIDGTGKDPIEKGIVAIEDNKIVLVARQAEYQIPENVETIDVGDGTIMPGFIDQHTHLGALGDKNTINIFALSEYEKTCQAVHDMGKLVQAGFTSARECGGFANYLKAPIAKGLVV